MSHTPGMDLAEFLLQRIAEDEAVARAATGKYGRWELDDGDDLDAYEVAVFPERGGSTCIARTWPSADGLGDAQHIARHDPARVLAECEGKRQIVDAATVTIDIYRGGTVLDFAWETLRHLALPYADHPDYREEWRP